MLLNLPAWLAPCDYPRGLKMPVLAKALRSMYSPDTLYDIWFLELFVFGDTPEDEEPMFEHPGDSFGMHGMRHTRRHVVEQLAAPPTDTDEGSDEDVVFYWRYDPETKRVITRRADH